MPRALAKKMPKIAKIEAQSPGQKKAHKQQFIAHN